MLAELIALLLIALVVLLPIVLLIARLRSGEPTTGGSSWGRQYFGRRDDDWGPQPTRSASLVPDEGAGQQSGRERDQDDDRPGDR